MHRSTMALGSKLLPSFRAAQKSVSNFPASEWILSSLSNLEFTKAQLLI